MRDFVDRELRAAEQRPSVLSASLGHGFPWGDAPASGARALVVADRDAALANEVAEVLARSFYDRRHDVTIRPREMDEALEHALAGRRGSGPVVFAELSDNSGGGAPRSRSAGRRRGRPADAAARREDEPLPSRLCTDRSRGIHMSGPGAEPGPPKDRPAQHEHPQVPLDRRSLEPAARSCRVGAGPVWPVTHAATRVMVSGSCTTTLVVVDLLIMIPSPSQSRDC